MRAAAKHDLARAEFTLGAADCRLEADSTPALEQEVRCQRVRHDGQVLAPPYRGIEIADRRGGPALLACCSSAARNSRRGSLRSCRRRTASAAAAANCVRRCASGVHCSSGVRGGSESARRGRAVLRQNRDRSRACGNRAARPPSPSRAPEPLPLVVISGDAAQRDHAHHGRAAADDAPLVVSGRGRIVPVAPMRLQPRPHVVLVVVGRGIDIEDIRRLLPRRRVSPRLEKQNDSCRNAPRAGSP